MKIAEILAEDKLSRQDIGFGLSQYEGKEYSLVGGSRSGSSPAGLSRHRYDIVDHAAYDRTNDIKQSKLGTVELFVTNTGAIDGLVNIIITSKKAGTGSRVVKDLVDTAGGTLRIYDIQPKAAGFWKKMGAELVQNKPYSAVIE